MTRCKGNKKIKNIIRYTIKILLVINMRPLTLQEAAYYTLKGGKLQRNLPPFSMVSVSY